VTLPESEAETWAWAKASQMRSREQHEYTALSILRYCVKYKRHRFIEQAE
jgi:hypothetical protein